jgi:hypothetical protein
MHSTQQYYTVTVTLKELADKLTEVTRDGFEAVQVLYHPSHIVDDYRYFTIIYRDL